MGLAALGVMVALAGCSSGKWGFPYRIDVQQGNWITQEQVALLQTGMSREQVRFALGSPMLTSVLHADRWDYPYYYKPGYGDARERKFTVWFENDRLVRWSGDQQPTLQPYQLDDDGNPVESAPPLAQEAQADAADKREDEARAAESKAIETLDSDQARKQDEGSRQVTPNVVVQPPASPSPYSPGLPGGDAQPLR